MRRTGLVAEGENAAVKSERAEADERSLLDKKKKAASEERRL